MTKDPTEPQNAAVDLAALFDNPASDRSALGDLLGDPEWLAGRRATAAPAQASAPPASPIVDHRPFLAGLAALAEVDASALIDDFERAGPLALALSRMFSLREPEPPGRRGRPPNDRRIKAIHDVITRLMLDHDLSEKEAIRQAPDALYKLGIKGNGPESRPMHWRSVQEALKQYARIWFDPIDETSGS